MDEKTKPHFLRVHPCMFANCKEPMKYWRFVYRGLLPGEIQYMCEKHKDMHEKDSLNGTPRPA